MSFLSETEFAALRYTIATRGTVRMAMVPLTFLAWAALALVETRFTGPPVAALLSLATLAAGFEAIHALHVGVERIGRYLQVFYEEVEAGRGDRSAPPPRWETTAMSMGPALPGGGIDPLFSALFIAATVVNLVPVVLPQPAAIEIAVIAGLHVVFIVRVLRARLAAGKQRAVELEAYRRLRGERRT